MLRLVVFGVFISSVIAGNVEDVVFVDSKTELEQGNYGIDPIITGHTVDTDHLARWKVKNEMFLKCGNCGQEIQAYPGDLD